MDYEYEIRHHPMLSWNHKCLQPQLCVLSQDYTQETHDDSGEIDTLTTHLAGVVKFLYFHLMGEPFLHPQLPQFIHKARNKGFIPVVTTNGTLLSQRSDMLDALPHKLQISLHSHEGNNTDNPQQYIDEVMTFAQEAARRGCIVVLRLWNEGGHNQMNVFVKPDEQNWTRSSYAMARKRSVMRCATK